MQVEWIFGIPELTKYGVSEHLVVLTNKGTVSAAYYSKKHDEWMCDTCLMRDEKVIAWLSGLES